MRRRQRVTGAVTAALALAAGVWASGIAPAQAAARDGNCESGEFCYYYDTGGAGSASDFTASLANYGTAQPSCYEFRGTGNGQGLCIKNRAASAWNRSGQTVRVYYNSNFAGASQDIAPGARTDLIATLRKENASHAFIGAPAQPPVVPPQQAPWPTPAPPPRECIPDAQNTAGARAGFDVFIASARCTGGVPQATLSMTIATWSKASGWTTRVKPTVSYTSPTTIRYPQSYLVDPAQAADGWALARVCWEAGLTTVCRDDYAYLRGGHSQPPVLR